MDDKKPSIGKKTAEKKPKQERNSKGQFVKGNSGGGRPKLPDDLKQAFREAAPDALRVLKKVLLDEDEATKNRIRAAEIILDRGYGKPVQAVDLDASSVPQVVFIGDVPD